MTLAECTPGMKPYRPYGGILEALYAKEDEVVVCGPAGTGKSLGVLTKVHICAEKYAGMRALIVRKTRASLTDAALVTFETEVLPDGHGALAGPHRENRRGYHYPNGSEIVIGGMDRASRIMSTQFDLIYPQEAIEFTEHDWETLTTRLRNGVMPYQQMVADTNPDKPGHWLKQRCDANQCRLIESRHEDNPRLFDQETGAYTEEGKRYLSKLDRLTGARHARLRLGKWAASEGQVYENWDAAIHLIDRFEIPESWKRYWVVDFGYTNPFVWQDWAEDGDGRLYRVREIYMTGRLVEDHAATINNLGLKKPEALIGDHDAEGRATLEKHLGMKSVAAKKTISDGIQAVQARLNKAGDSKPRLFMLRDAVIERDQALVDQKLPCSSEEEIDGYIWDIREGKKKGEIPVDKDNHGMDTTRYMVAFKDLTQTHSWQVW